jgi:hypothetical protein
MQYHLIRIDKHNLSGASSFAFSCGTSCTKQTKPKWVVVGHVGGFICRAQVSKLGGNPLNAVWITMRYLIYVCINNPVT